MRKYLACYTPKKIALVFGVVLWCGQKDAALFWHRAHIVTCGQVVAAQGLCSLPKGAKFDGGIAAHTRVWRVAFEITLGKGRNDLFFKGFFKVNKVERYVKMFSHGLSVFLGVRVAAVFVYKLHMNGNDLVAGFLQ